MSKGEQTRRTILRAAFELIYANGYQATSINEILKKTHVTKGAFFHHFKNKDEMGLAMIEEIMYPGMYKVMISPLLKSTDSIEGIYNMIESLLHNTEIFDAKYGCPAVNLIDEMAPLKPSFNKALAKLTNNWKQAIEENLENAISNGQIDSSANPKQISLFIISGYAGIRNYAKLYGQSYYDLYINELAEYLKNL